jgi:hypothetical protein
LRSARRQSQAQRATKADFAAAGVSYALCCSINDVHAAPKAAGIPVYATPLAAALW